MRTPPERSADPDWRGPIEGFGVRVQQSTRTSCPSSPCAARVIGLSLINGRAGYPREALHRDWAAARPVLHVSADGSDSASRLLTDFPTRSLEVISGPFLEHSIRSARNPPPYLTWRVESGAGRESRQSPLPRCDHDGSLPPPALLDRLRGDRGDVVDGGRRDGRPARWCHEGRRAELLCRASLLARLLQAGGSSIPRPFGKRSVTDGIGFRSRRSLGAGTIL